VAGLRIPPCTGCGVQWHFKWTELVEKNKLNEFLKVTVLCAKQAISMALVRLMSCLSK
jgi:hypothetical protein